MMAIRRARRHEWEQVRDFCTNTFSWGDYIEQVWHSWVDAGSLLAYETDGAIQGICNLTIMNGEAWVEGVRVRASSRRMGIGSALLREAERVAVSAGATHGRSGVESRNEASLRMFGLAGYRPERDWHMYRCDARQHSRPDVSPAPPHLWPDRYVESWMWVRPDSATPPDKVVHVPGGPVAVLAESERFPGCMMATIHVSDQSDDPSCHYMIEHAADAAFSKGDTLQIFSTRELRHPLLKKESHLITVMAKRFPAEP